MRKEYRSKGTTLLKYSGKEECFIVPAEIIKIKDNAFEKCENLKRIIIHKAVSIIESWAFVDCPNLIEIIVEDDNEKYASVDGNLFNKDKSILLRYASGKKETSFIIPSGITSIGEAAFLCCKNLTEVKIPKTVTKIGDCAFTRCCNLVHIELPDLIEIIGCSAFSYCSKLESIKLPIGETKTRFGCTWNECRLKEINYGLFEGCIKLKQIDIPYGIRHVCADAFAKCSNLMEVKLPDTIWGIQHYSFYYCENLRYIEIPNTISYIQDYAISPKCIIVSCEEKGEAYKYAIRHDIEFCLKKE